MGIDGKYMAPGKTSKEKNNTWVNLNDFKGESGLRLHYAIIVIPHFFIISPEGKILDAWTGYKTGGLKEKMKELVK